MAKQKDMLFEDYKDVLANYCAANSLDFEKLCSMSRCWNHESIGFGYNDPEKDGSRGLYDDTPMPAVLFVIRDENGNLTFEQTEHTVKYLAMSVPTIKSVRPVHAQTFNQVAGIV
ncbi:hypothetical protein FACS1894120_5310 [Clostridia bacterium]|nr:hypothetical protein FACS1894120_5310 [Clostridia bacterium]